MFRAAYYQLGLAHFESGQPENLICVSRQLLERVPEDKKALLFCGLGYQAGGEYQRAYESYGHALSQMDAEERAAMESVDLIDGEGEESPTVQDEQPIAPAASESPGRWADGPKLARFWRRQDPLFLTDFNERRVEHYGRVAYANLRFGQPRKGLAGSQTDMGRTHIRFGRCIRRMARRADVITPKTSRDPFTGIPPKKE